MLPDQKLPAQSFFTGRLLPWIICFSASLFFFYEFIQGTMFASVADNIMHDFHIQADKMTYLSSIYYFSCVLFLFAAGFLLDKYPPKKIIMVAMSLCVLSTFILSYAESFYLVLLCRFIAGIGSAFCFLGPIRLVSGCFPQRQMAMVTGVIVTMAMLGGMVAQYPLTKLIMHLGWRNAVMDVGWLGVLILLIMMIGIVEKPFSSPKLIIKKKSSVDSIKNIYLNSQILRAGLYTSLMNMATAVFGAMMGTLYLMQRLNLEKEDAAVINSMLFLGTIVGGPLIGWISDKMRLRLLPMKLGAMISLGIVLAILFLPVSVSIMKILFFFLGFFTAAQIISYPLVAENNGIEKTARAVSVVSILTQGGYIVYQNLFSALLVRHGQVQLIDATPVYSLGDYQYAALILPLGLICALLLLIGLKETHARRIEESNSNLEMSANLTQF